MYKLIKYRVRGKMLDIIISMYENVRSKVKYNNTLSDDFSWGILGVRQGESLSPFLFSMYLSDNRGTFHSKWFWRNKSWYMFKLFFVIICWWYCNCARNRSVKHGLFFLNYCVRCKLTVNATETKVMKG